MQACRADLARLCPGQHGRSAWKCLVKQPSSISSGCRTALAAALQPGSAATQTQLDRLCIPSVLRQCKAEAMDLMIRNTEGTSLIACAKKHSKTISPNCEASVAKLTKDGFSKQLLTCGAKFSSLCPKTVISLVLKAKQTSGKLQPSDFVPLMKCIAPQAKDLTESCREVVNAFKPSTQKDTSTANPEKPEGQHSGAHMQKEHKRHGEGGKKGGGMILFLIIVGGLTTVLVLSAVAFLK